MRSEIAGYILTITRSQSINQWTKREFVIAVVIKRCNEERIKSHNKQNKDFVVFFSSAYHFWHHCYLDIGEETSLFIFYYSVNRINHIEPDILCLFSTFLHDTETLTVQWEFKQISTNSVWYLSFFCWWDFILNETIMVANYCTNNHGGKHQGEWSTALVITDNVT